MKLVFYSGGRRQGNWTLHEALVGLTGRRKRVSLTYIPFCSDGAEIYFNRAVRRYRRFGVSRFGCLSVDGPDAPAPDELRRAWDSDIVYLAGGNTFYLLSWLRKRRLLEGLRDYAVSGGVIAGLSAGAHIITPNIRLAGLPGLDPDRNEVGLRRLAALDLVRFEFMPHFDSSSRKGRILRKYSERNPNPIYACADGGGIVLDGDRFTVHGQSWVFYRGDGIRLNR